MTSNHRSAGFTLFELVVALAIFSVVILISMSIFSRFIFNQRQSIGEQQLQEDVRIALELMSREIRTGYGTTFESSSAPSQLFFRNQDGLCIRYRFANDTNNRRLIRGQADTADPCSGATYAGQEQAITEFGAGSQLESIVFTSRAAQTTNDQLIEQGYVTINLALKRLDLATPVYVQSTIASRNNIPYE